MSLTKENYKIDEKIKRAYISSFNNVSDEVYYLILIASKIVRYDFEKKLIKADIKRLYDEFVYFKYYSEMSKDYLLNFFMPIILVNRNFEAYEEVAKELAEKLCRFYGIEGEKYKYILDIYCYDSIVRNMLIEKKDMLDNLKKIKDALIEFNPYRDNKIQNLKFQIEKIKYIEVLHKLIDSYEIEEKNSLYTTGIGILDVFQAIYSQDACMEYSQKEDDGLRSLYYVLLSLLEDKTEENSEDLDYKKKSNSYRKFIQDMAEHILKIRYGRVKISPYIKKASPKAFLEKEVGEEFFDPILNMARLESREILQEAGQKKIEIKLSSKTGIYKFQYKLLG